MSGSRSRYVCIPRVHIRSVKAAYGCERKLEKSRNRIHSKTGEWKVFLGKAEFSSGSTCQQAFSKTAKSREAVKITSNIHHIKYSTSIVCGTHLPAASHRMVV